MQYFYLVMINGYYDEPSYPAKVFLQFEQALKFARKCSTQITKEEQRTGWDSYKYISIYRQPMTSMGQIELMDVEIIPFAQIGL